MATLLTGILNKRSVTNDSVANVGTNAKFSNLFKNEEFVGPFSTIKNLWLCNVNSVVIGNLDIDSLHIKFNQLEELVLKYVDILVLTETKLDFIWWILCEPFRIDRKRSGGGVIIYVRDDTLSRLLTKHFFPDDIESFL